MIPIENALTSHLFNGYSSFTAYIVAGSRIIENYVLKNNGKMFYVNACYDVIDDFIAIYKVLEMALSFMLYIMNDAIMCSNIYILPLFIF